MPFISDTASAIKSRFGFSSQSSDPVPPVQSTPDLFKSTAKKNLAHQLVSASAIPSIGEWDEDSVDGSGTSSQSFELSEDPSFWKDHNVQVIIRIRPLSSSEISTQGYSKCVRQESSQTVTWTGPPPSRYTFDHVADENVSQEKLFKVAGVPMVENCVEGYNSCMFAYGQTGSGKTHTMLGDIEGGTRRHSVNCGMTPRVFEYLFSRIQKEKEARREEKLRFICKCSFLEIYNEHILDLLEPSTNNLQIREDIKKGIHVENLKEIEVTSARDVMQQLIQGASNRKVAATNMNRASSRSHSVFTCIIESKWESQGVTHHRFARLNLVDLAGSERQKSSGAEGDRLKEATNINKSLSTLGLVIMNLVNISNGKSHHVPYRDSKLTFLLQDSLGGNSKTIIIANISPANCCSLETLSTLKFAQRAKFIKNNAIVNEDASGDVIAMRVQIQELKKEISRLRSSGNGGDDNQNSDALTVSFPGSPGSSKWEGFYGSLSPLATSKKTSQKKDYEVALLGAFRREKDKDLALQALAAETQGALQLAKQREDEIQSLKMRLRFREAAVKRLETVASGKISAETHLLKEREEHLKEIEVLKTQVDRNQEVTRFAMENLRLKEEIRRLKSFCEQGEREMMSEQIMGLHKMLVEALDWKLMHESDPTANKKTNSVSQVHGDDSLLGTSQEPGTPWRSSVDEENEFLRMQAIQNQSEMDSLHRKLDRCLEEKEKLERQVNELVKELGDEGSSRGTKGEGTQETEHPSLSTTVPVVNSGDHIELKTMVDAIACASEREAEAHERAIILAKENDELRNKFMVLLEDNNKLIELYEQAAAESNYNNMNKANIAELGTEVQNIGQSGELAEEKESEMKTVQNLEHQLMEMNEENEKLMGLYEKAMHERDEFKRILSSNGEGRVETRGQFDCPEKLVEVDEAKDATNESVKLIDSTVSEDAKMCIEEASFVQLDARDGSSSCLGDHFSDAANQMEDGDISYMETDQPKDATHESVKLIDSTVSEDAKMCIEEASFVQLDARDGSSSCLGDHFSDAANQMEDGDISYMETDQPNVTAVILPEDLNLARTKLEKAQELLSDSARTVSLFGSLEKAIIEVDRLTKEIEASADGIQVKQEQLESLKLLSSELQERSSLVDKKLLALKYSLSNFSSSVVYFEQREARARARVTASITHLNQKKEEMARLQTRQDETEASQRKVQKSEVELRNNLVSLKSKFEEENKRQENEKVLFAIDNVEKVDPAQRNWNLGGKATELLKSEEEKTKLQAEMKQVREKLGVTKREYEDLDRKLGKIKGEIQAVQKELQKASHAVEETELALENVVKEKEMLLEVKENGKTEIGSMIIEYQQHVFEFDLKEEEKKMVEEELGHEMKRIEDLQKVKAGATKAMARLLEEGKCSSCFLSEKMVEELQSVHASVLEAKTLLLGEVDSVRHI